MLVIKQYIQRKNLYRQTLKPDIHEYNEIKKPLESSNQKQPATPASSKASNQTKSTKVSHTLKDFTHKKNKEKESTSAVEANNNNKLAKQANRMSKSSTNLYSDALADNTGSTIPMLREQYAHPRPSNAYERLNNNFNPNFAHNSSFVINQSQSNLYDYNAGFNPNNNNNNNNFDNYDGFKLVTRNGSTKIVNGQNDDISEYEIPIIRYNDRPTRMQQY